GMEKWFLRICEIKNKAGLVKTSGDFIVTGDQFIWRWHGWPDDVQEKGEILEANGTDQVRFTFGQEGAEDMICTVKLYTEEGENICEIIQENIPDNEKGKTYYHIGCLTGWSFYLTNMKSILENGADLRNKNEQLKKMINS
ncbi:MAG: hypothetical protein ABI707_16355, partial [Ferruginibacter sp.]